MLIIFGHELMSTLDFHTCNMLVHKWCVDYDYVLLIIHRFWGNLSHSIVDSLCPMETGSHMHVYKKGIQIHEIKSKV